MACPAYLACGPGTSGLNWHNVRQGDGPGCVCNLLGLGGLWDGRRDWCMLQAKGDKKTMMIMSTAVCSFSPAGPTGRCCTMKASRWMIGIGIDLTLLADGSSLFQAAHVQAMKIGLVCDVQAEAIVPHCIERL